MINCFSDIFIRTIGFQILKRVQFHGLIFAYVSQRYQCLEIIQTSGHKNIIDFI